MKLGVLMFKEKMIGISTKFFLIMFFVFQYSIFDSLVDNMYVIFMY